jgi:hypothetical protein
MRRLGMGPNPATSPLYNREPSTRLKYPGTKRYKFIINWYETVLNANPVKPYPQTAPKKGGMAMILAGEEENAQYDPAQQRLKLATCRL